MAELSRKKIYKRILKQLKNYKLSIAATIFFALLNVACTLITPIFFGDVIDLIASGGKIDFGAISVRFAIIGALIGAACLAQWLMGAVNNSITYGVVKDVRRQAFENIQNLPIKYIDEHPYGDIVGRVIADVDQFADGLLMGFTQLFTGVLTILGTLVIMLVINWVIALVVFFITPLSLFMARFIARKTYSMFRTASKIRGEQTAFIDEMVGNLKVVKAFSREDENTEIFDEINGRLTESSLKSIFFSSLVNPGTRFINAIAYAAVALSGALMLTLNTPLPVAFSIGLLNSLLVYANQYTKPFNEISGVVTELQNAVACAGRIYEVIDATPQKDDLPSAAGLSDVRGEVGFEHVYFSYSADKKLIEDFNLDVKGGQRIAIVGPTGCGKTTLINLLMRFYDADDGVISVDGRDVMNIKRKSLRSNYGMVLQDTWLKSGTVFENIAIGKPGATLEEVQAAAKAAHAHNFIMQLPGGYGFVLSEDGGNLSQGQKQLLCISRIMLSLPPMLILDEATSSIDTRTELQIQDAFAKLMKGRTSFIVAHRLSTVREADMIIVMKDGKIVEKGTHDQLIELKGFYYGLYNSQFAV